MAKKRPSSKSKSRPTSKSNTPSTGFSSKAPKSTSESAPTAEIEQKSEEKSKETDKFIPRGPTLRAEFERKGLVEPSVSTEAGILPEKVANRMLRRIIIFGGVPLSLLFAFFALYFILKYKYDITVLPGVVATSTLGAVGLATAGITYGILSSSWDEQDGSRLGLEEAKTNFIRARDGLLGARQREKIEDELDRLDQIAEDEEKKNSS